MARAVNALRQSRVAQGRDMKPTKLLVMALAIATPAACAQQSSEPKTDAEKFSYAVGAQIGQNLQRQGVEYDAKALTQGIQDAVSGTKLKLSETEMRTAIETRQKQEVEKREALSKKNLETGKAFLADNKGKPGVVARESGLQYKVIQDGKGKQPKSTDTVQVHYRGTLINGTEFDSSHKRGEPVTFPVNGVIKGWQEVLPLMKEGAKWQVWIPSELAYGPRGAGHNIAPNETLIFEIELLAVK
jgi:FKBP-type peptidyl-prolyl cis-trans isomerase FklB